MPSRSHDPRRGRVILAPVTSPARAVRRLVGEILAGFDRLLGETPPVRGAVIRLFAAVVLVWWIQVPIHELLHAAGCFLTGGQVTKLAVSPLYGGTVLERIFPFVVAGGEYAGRLEGFEPSSDLGYLVTIFAPYLLTLLLGIPLVRSGRRRRSPEIFAAGVVFTLLPWISIPGDYFELASVALTGLVGWSGLAPLAPDALRGLRSDDLFRLVGEIRLPARTIDAVWTIGLLGASLLVAAGLALLTCEGSRRIADLGIRDDARGDGRAMPTHRSP